MKFSEAMKALEDGKKVRCCSWGEEEWVNKDTILPDWMRLNCSCLIDQYWEVYEEPKPKLSFVEVVKGLKQGKIFKRAKWPEGMYVYEDKYEHVHINLYGGELWHFKIEDFEATDWQETDVLSIGSR